MHVLLTNDDGVFGEGLRVLREELLALGARVTVVAPEGERSGVGRAITIDGPVSVKPAGGTAESPVFACSGTPVDCVRIGLLSELVARADLVLAGINHGLNAGDDATYSGTVGAALEAALLGYPAAAFSQQRQSGSFRHDVAEPGIDFPLAGTAARLALALAGSPPPGRAALSVNLPVANGEPELALTRPGRRSYHRGFLAPAFESAGDSHFHPYGTPWDLPAPYEDEPGTDFFALGAGRISVSVISPDWGDHDGSVDLRRWFESFRIGGS